MRFPFGSLAVLALVAAATADSAPPPVDDTTWLERSRQILEESMAAGRPNWLEVQPDDSAVEAAGEIAEQAMHAEPPASSDRSVSGRVMIFASFSIPRATLKSLLSQATEENVMLVLRGVPPGTSIQEALRRLKELIPEGERLPKVILDPTLFRRYGVQTAPTFVLERDAGRRPVQVVGAINVSWLRRMAASVQPGQEHLGKRAEDYEIQEVDLIEEMQQRLARVDWAAQREAARAKFWQRRQEEFASLADAPEQRERLIDPSVRLTQDMYDADGGLLMSAGQTVNPLDWMPLSKSIVIFRGTDARHVAKARELAASARAAGRGVILLTTTVDVQRGWEHLSELENALSGVVYVLPISFVDRFRLARIPATITSHGNKLLLTEVPAGGSQ